MSYHPETIDISAEVLEGIAALRHELADIKRQVGQLHVVKSIRPEWLRFRLASSVYQVSKGTLRGWVESGDVESRKVNGCLFVSRSSIDAYIGRNGGAA